MAARRTYDNRARQLASEQTRQAILEAFVEQLGQEKLAALSVPLAAARAQVSVRTVYHHFPDEQARVDALAEWAERAFGPLDAPLDRVEDLPAFVRAAYERAGRHIELARTMARTALGNEVRLRRLRARRQRFRELLASIGAPPGVTRNAAATVALLASSEAGVPLMDLHGLSFEQATDAAVEAVVAIIERLRKLARAR